MRCVAEGDQHGRRCQRAEEGGEPDAQHRPVRVHAGIGIDRPDRSERKQRRQGQGHTHGKDGSGQGGGEEADQAVQFGRGGVGPDRPHDHQVALAGTEHPGNDLQGQEQRGQSGDTAEDSERERLGSYRLLGRRLRLGGDLKVGEELLGRVPPPFDGGNAGRTTTQLHSQIDGLTGRHGPREGRCRHDVGGVLGDLVLHDLPVQQADADHLERDAPRRFGAGARGDRHRQPRAEVEAHGRRGVLRDHHLVRPRRIGHAAARDGQAILIEEKTVDAAHQEDLAAGRLRQSLPSLVE